jgi:adenylate cyclase class 2
MTGKTEEKEVNNVNSLTQKEAMLVEMKAKVDSLEPFRQKLTELKAKHIGTFKQTDTYYEVPTGRLKTRETEGQSKVQLVYYERPDIQDLKQSRVFILEFDKADYVKQFIDSNLRVKTVVEKQRTIYRHNGTQIHLDNVKNLGTYIELEHPTQNTPQANKQVHLKLQQLMAKLGVKPENLQKGSYSDLTQQRQQQP